MEERFAELSEQDLAESLDISDPEQSLLMDIVLCLFLQFM
jgi:hypothetical protein